VGMYPAKVASFEYETPGDKDPRFHLIYEITNGKFAQIHDYVTFGETSKWKMDQMLQALGEATDTKRKGSLNTDKQKGKKVKIRVRGETYNEEYRAKIGGVWQPADDMDEEFDSDGDEEPTDDADEPTEYDERWSEILGMGEDDLADIAEELDVYNEPYELDADAYDTWEEFREALNDAMNEAEPEEPEEEPEEEEEDIPYEDWKLQELKNELEARELDATGTKAALISRLEEDDEAASPFDE
jgi:SAP domain